MAGNLCAYAKCMNSRAKVKGLRMFYFPRCSAKIWAQNSGNPDLVALSPDSLSKRKLCERHFRQQDILPSGRLLKGALPQPYTTSESVAGPSCSSPIQSPALRVRRELTSPKRYIGISEKPSPCVSTPSSNFIVEDVSPLPSTWIDNASPNLPRKIIRRTLFKTPSSKTELKNKKSSALLAAKRAQISKLKRQLLKCRNHTKIGNIHFKTKEANLLFKMQTHKKRQPWTKSERDLAISLYLRSPSTYKYLQKILILPGESTIRRWLSSKKCHSTGFDKNLMEKLKIKSNTMTEMEKACVVMFDDMAIKQCLEYSPQYDLIEGFEDMGTLGRTDKIAKQATVFMIRGLFYQWKLPIGYFVSEKGLNGIQSKAMIETCLENLADVGLAVKAIVCDQSSTNSRAYKELGVTMDKPYFLTGKGEKVFAIFDPPHLLKSLRNNLLNHDFTFDSKIVSFSDIRKLFEIEVQSGTTRAAHQLTPSHIWPNSFQKMSVSLAVQVFSHTTSAALKTAVATGQLQTPTALNTSDFVGKINSVFDAMNSRRCFSKNPDKCALSNQNIHIINIFKDALSLFSSLTKIKAKRPRPPCFDGFILTITAFLGLLESENCKYLLTSRLNQDPLENLFSSVRQRGGFNRNPTVRVLRSTLKLLTVQQFLEPPKSSSYDPDLDKLLEVPQPPLPEPSSAPEIKLTEDGSSQTSTVSSNGEDEPVSSSRSSDAVTLEDCSQVYFSGYLVQNYNKKFKCKDCFQRMCDAGSTLTNRKELLLLNKSYSNIKVDPSSGLLSPSERTLHVTSAAFKVFSKLYKRIGHKKHVVRRLIRITEKIVSCDSMVCSNCGDKQSKYFLNLLFKVLLYKQCKWTSSNLKDFSIGKLRILKHV